jgi:hypothetical protein
MRNKDSSAGQEALYRFLARYVQSYIDSTRSFTQDKFTAWIYSKRSADQEARYGVWQDIMAPDDSEVRNRNVSLGSSVQAVIQANLEYFSVQQEEEVEEVQPEVEEVQPLQEEVVAAEGEQAKDSELQLEVEEVQPLQEEVVARTYLAE